MIANVRIYDGQKSNAESNLLRTVQIIDVTAVQITGAKNDIYKIIRANGDIHKFATDTTNILIE